MAPRRPPRPPMEANSNDEFGDEALDEAMHHALDTLQPQPVGSELLDTTIPNRVGNRVIVQPFNRNNAGAVATANLLGPGALTTIIQLQGKWTKSRLVTLALSRDMFTEDGSIHRGPIVARVAFGAGGITRFFEVDVPIPGSVNLTPGGDPDYQGQGVVTMQVPAAGLIVSARDDSMQACSFTDETGTANQAQDGEGANGQYKGVGVYAHVSYGAIQHTADHTPKRSVVFANGNGGAWSAGDGINVPIPPSARQVRFFRGDAVPTTIAVQWTLFNGIVYTTTLVGTGPNSMEVPSSAVEMIVFNGDVGDATNPVMVIEFDIEP